MDQQLSLFSELMPKKVINKEIRLIEFFAGIGAQHKALSILGVPFKSHKIVEWAYNSILSYNAIHIKDFKDYSVGKTKEEMINRIRGISVNYNEPLNDEQLNKKNIEWIKNAYNSCEATHNLINIMNVHGKDLEINNKDKYEYILTYSFPCQDLSLAGKRAGMAVSQKNGGTRSGLLWEVERILCELDKEHRPDCLILENVPEVIGKDNYEHFAKWELKLEELGYQNYTAILNGKNYGIPQNRRRCFMVSILGDYSYEFPQEIKLKYRLKDLLEEKVDEKYYLSDAMLNYISANNSKWTGNNNKSLINRDIGCTINTNPVGRRCDASNYVSEKLGDNIDLKKIISIRHNKSLEETLKNNKVNDGDFIDTYNRNVKKDIAGTITTGVSFRNETFLCVKNKTKLGYLEADIGDGIDIGSRMEDHRGTVQKGLSQTIKTSIDIGVISNEREREKGLRIRKLTPKECLKLMGFERKDYESMRNVGMSDAAIYHCAGDSIITTCLVGIIGSLLNKDTTKVIEEYVEKLVNEKF